MSKFKNEYINNLWVNNKMVLLKTMTYFVMHITVAMMVAYAVTRNFWMSVSLSLIEPAVQAFAFFFHERVWNKKTELYKNSIVDKQLGING